MITLLNQWGESWLTYFGPLVLQNTLFLGLVLMALHLLREAPARIKYIIGMVGLVKLLLPAFIPLPILNTPTITNVAVGDISLTTPITTPTTVVSSLVAARPILPNYEALLLMLWAGVAVIVFLVPFFSLIKLKARLRSAVPLHDDINAAKSTVSLYKCNQIAVPLTVGFFPKRLYVPEEWDEWTDEQRRMMIEHELAHIRRRDGLAGLFQMLVQALYAFHPLVWLLNRRLNEFREMACDDAIVKENKGTSISYSRFLADVAAGIAVTQPGCISTATLIRQKNELLKRVKYQLEDTMRKYSRLRAGLLLAVLTIMILPTSFNCAAPAKTDQGPEELVTNNGSDTVTSQSTQGETDVSDFMSGSMKFFEWGAKLRENVVYPEAALKDGIEGTVWVRATLSTEGTVTEASVVPDKSSTTDPRLIEAAVDAAWRTTFTPYDDPDLTVAGTFEVPIEFRLDDASGDDQPGSSSQATTMSGNISDTASTDTPGIDVERILGLVMPMPEGGFEAIMANVVYPEAARRAGLEGKVVLKLTVDTNGEIQMIEIKETTFENDLGLHQAAIDAVRSVKWNRSLLADFFEEARGDYTLDIPIEFRLDEANGNDQPGGSSQAAPVTGKIYGMVTNEQTGEPLPAANIILEGTTMGAATDNNGQYFITNVPPGNYTLRANYLGFQSVVYTAVSVKVMESTEVNFSLRETVLEYDSGSITPQPTPGDENLADYSFPFIAYEALPEPIGGPAAIQENIIYPESALNAGVEGTVTVMAFINEVGRITETRILEGIPDSGLDEAAIEAVRRTAFAPAKQRDRNVGVWLSIPVEFKIDE